MTNPNQIEQLEAALDAGTQGEWQVTGVRSKFGSLNPQAQFHAIGPDQDEVAAVFYDPKTGLGFADAKLITLLHNNARQLIAAAKNEVKLREALENIASIDPAFVEANGGFEGAIDKIIGRARNTLEQTT